MTSADLWMGNRARDRAGIRNGMLSQKARLNAACNLSRDLTFHLFKTNNLTWAMS